MKKQEWKYLYKECRHNYEELERNHKQLLLEHKDLQQKYSALKENATLMNQTVEEWEPEGLKHTLAGVFDQFENLRNTIRENNDKRREAQVMQYLEEKYEDKTRCETD